MRELIAFFSPLRVQAILKSGHLVLSTFRISLLQGKNRRRPEGRSPTQEQNLDFRWHGNDGEMALLTNCFASFLSNVNDDTSGEE
jgi:hypothetical protein